MMFLLKIRFSIGFLYVYQSVDWRIILMINSQRSAVNISTRCNRTPFASRCSSLLSRDGNRPSLREGTGLVVGRSQVLMTNIASSNAGCKLENVSVLDALLVLNYDGALHVKRNTKRNTELAGSIHPSSISSHFGALGCPKIAMKNAIHWMIETRNP